MDNRPVGVFDSGLGGLTAARKIRSILPSEDIIYFGDTSRVPYGGRSREILLKYARQDVRFLRSFDIKAIVVAAARSPRPVCRSCRRRTTCLCWAWWSLPARRAVAVSKTRHVGLIATAASVRSGTYEQIIHALDPDVTVTARACPLFVPLVENGRYERGDIVIETVAREYLEPIRGSGIDTLILGCTHYPLLMDLIGEIMGPEVTLIDTGEEAAWELKRTLKAKDLLSDCAQEGTTTLYASDQPEDFGSMAKHFLQEELTSPVLQVNIDRY